jgi:Recombinase zinc beta ribbon domain
MAPQVPPGYVRGPDGVLVPDAPETVEAVVDAHTLRAGGATLGQVREQLRSRGLNLSYAAVQRMFNGKLAGSRAYLGEVHFGDLSNLDAHPAVVDRDLWKAAQRTKPSPGRRAKSTRLLARLGVLRCGSCGRKMSASTGHGGTWPLYRCSAHAGDRCPRKSTIGAELVEGIVAERVREALARMEGRASAEQGARDAAQALERAQADLDAAIRAFGGLEDETAARERLAELRQARDTAQERVDQLGGTRATVTLNAATDWDRLTLGERRALIRATVDRVEIAPGRGPGRVTVKLVGE